MHITKMDDQVSTREFHAYFKANGFDILDGRSDNPAKWDALLEMFEYTNVHGLWEEVKDPSPELEHTLDGILRQHEKCVLVPENWLIYCLSCFAKAAFPDDTFVTT